MYWLKTWVNQRNLINWWSQTEGITVELGSGTDLTNSLNGSDDFKKKIWGWSWIHLESYLANPFSNQSLLWIRHPCLEKLRSFMVVGVVLQRRLSHILLFPKPMFLCRNLWILLFVWAMNPTRFPTPEMKLHFDTKPRKWPMLLLLYFFADVNFRALAYGLYWVYLVWPVGLNLILTRPDHIN